MVLLAGNERAYVASNELAYGASIMQYRASVWCSHHTVQSECMALGCSTKLVHGTLPGGLCTPRRYLLPLLTPVLSAVPYYDRPPTRFPVLGSPRLCRTKDTAIGYAVQCAVLRQPMLRSAYALCGAATGSRLWFPCAQLWCRG